MESSGTPVYQASSQNANVLTCAYHPTIVGDHKCYRCQKIICLQCYNPRGPGYGFCPQCHQNEPRGCCTVL